MLHGRDFLSPQEFETCLNRMMTAYYESLVGSMWRGRDRRYWSYHKRKLDEVGVGFSYKRLVKVTLSKLLDAILNPKRSIEKVIDVRKEAKQAQLDPKILDNTGISGKKLKVSSSLWKAFKHGEKA
jgi:hypothetical protein